MGIGTAFKELDAMAQGAGNAGRSLMGDSDVYQGYNKVRKAAAVIGFATHFASRKSEEALVKRVDELQRQASSSIAANSVAAGYQGRGMSNDAIQFDISNRISDNNKQISLYNDDITSARDAISKIDFSQTDAMDEYKKQSQAIADAQNKITSYNVENEMLSKAGADFNTLDRMNRHSSSLDAARSDIAAGQQNARYVQTIAVNKLLGGSFVGDAYNTFNTARMITGQIKTMHHKSVKASLEGRIWFNEKTKAHINNLIARTTPGSGVNRILNKASRRLDKNSANTRERIRVNNLKRTKAGRKKLADDNRALRAAERRAARRGRKDASFRGLEKQKADLAREINMARAEARSNFMGKGNKTGFYKSDEYKEFLRKNNSKYGRLNRLNKKIRRKSRTRAFFSRVDSRITGVKNWFNNRTLRKTRITALFSKLRMLNPLNLLKMAASKVIGVAIGALLQVILYVAMATGAMILISFFILHFASTLINGMRTDLTGELDGSQNWCQLILDHLYYDMGQEFEQVIKDDAFSHYFTYYYIVTPYYNVPLSVDYSTFGKSWIWEEADNTSRWVLFGDITDIGEDDGFTYGNPLFTVNDGVERIYDADGYLVSANAITWEEGKGESLNTYKDVSGAMEGATDMITWGNNADKLRTNVDPRLNVFPIMAMMHTKYIDNLNYEEWVTALAYTYYMYAMSHDVAKYDSNDSFRNFNLGGNDNGVDYLEEMRENEGMSGYNVNVFFHGERIFSDQSAASAGNAGTYGRSYVCVNSDYMGTEQRVYFLNHYVWQRKYSSYSGTGCDNVYYHSAATHPDGNGGYIIENGLSGQEDDTGEGHINGIYCETNVKLVQLFRRAVYEYIYSSAGDTAFGGHQTITESNMSYIYMVYYLHGLANGTKSDFRGTAVADLCTMMGISEDDLKKIYVPSDNDTYYYGRLGVTVNGIPGVQGYAFSFGENEFTPVHEWRKCDNYETINLADTALSEGQSCNESCYSPNGSIYDEKYGVCLHNGACLVAHEAGGIDNSGFNNTEGSGDSGTGCGWVYECNRMPNNDHRADGTLCHTHDKNGTCARHWQCNCERYHIEDTVYVCAGHCAGHLIPSTTVIQRLSYEGLAQGDGFKTTHWITEREIMGENVYTDVSQTIFGLGRVLGEADDAMMQVTELRTNIILKYGTGQRMPTLPEWKLFWIKRAQGWFSIIPSGPRAFYTVIGKRFIYAAAGGIDFFTNNLADFLENVFINHTGVLRALQAQRDKIISEALDKEAADPMNETTEFGDNNARDNLGFQGWFAPPSDYDYPTRYSQSVMSELRMFYGSFYDSNGNIIYQDPQRGFLVGVRNWKEFDVYFPEELLNALGQEGYYNTP